MGICAAKEAPEMEGDAMLSDPRVKWIFNTSSTASLYPPHTTLSSVRADPVIACGVPRRCSILRV